MRLLEFVATLFAVFVRHGPTWKEMMPDCTLLWRPVELFNNAVEQDHRAIKRVTSPMLNFKSFRAAGSVLAGIELLHMIRKGQFAIDGADAMSIADKFSALAGMVRPV